MTAERERTATLPPRFVVRHPVEERSATTIDVGANMLGGRRADERQAVLVALALLDEQMLRR